MRKNIKIGKLYDLPTAKAGWRLVKLTGFDNHKVDVDLVNGDPEGYGTNHIKRPYFDEKYEPRNRFALAWSVFWKILGA